MTASGFTESKRDMEFGKESTAILTSASGRTQKLMALAFTLGKMVKLFYLPLGDKYEGEWKACLRHGNGTDFFKNGDVYVGQYKYGKPDGFGQYKWQNGNTYTGIF